MPLTSTTVRNLKPTDKTAKHYDAAGLFLEIPPNGSKLWRFRYTFAGKQRLLAMGAYPAVSLADARKARDEARALLAGGMDPAAERRAKKAALADASLEAIALEWFAEVHTKKTTPSHSTRNRRRLEMHVYPALGKRPIQSIEAPELLHVLRAIERHAGGETARRIRNLLSQVWRYAVATLRATRDVPADLRDAIAPPPTRHQPAVVNLEEVAGLMRAIHGYRGHPVTVAALQLSALLFCRPGELRHLKWEHVRLAGAELDFQPSKGGAPMVTPLPRQAVAILTALENLTGRQEWIFPSLHGRGRPMSENTVNAALRRLGYVDTHSAHGFRAMARTLLVEHLEFPTEHVEMQLSHAVRDANGRAYNRTTFITQRRIMLQAWADFLEALATGRPYENPEYGENVVPMRNRAP